MTALAWDAPAAIRTRATSSSRRAVACDGTQPPRHLRLVEGPDAAASASLYWTRRGLIVAITAIVLLMVAMVATLVWSFLSVSDAPMEAGPASVAVMAMAPGR